jgi:Xaa-Pro aminopeptidase
VLKDKALLFTDGRYHNQAEMELKGSQWTLMKQGLKDVPSITEYLTRSLPEGATVGFDPMLHAAAPLKKMQEVIATVPML